jgi:hypothetical protein
VALNTYLIFYLVAPIGLFWEALVLSAYDGYHLYPVYATW